METFTSRNKKSKQDSKEMCNKTDPMVDSQFKQLKINHEKADLNKIDEVKSDVKVRVGNQRLLKFGSVSLPSSAKTPKPPEVPRSTAFCRKATASRLGGDGEACEEDIEDIDYSCIERLPGDGCISECTEDDDLLSDGYCEDDLLGEGIDDINDESCSEGILPF
jgi:hypothetical protein